MSKFCIIVAIMSLGLSGTLAHAQVRNYNAESRNLQTTLRLINHSKKPRRIADLLPKLTNEERMKAREQAINVEKLRKNDFEQAYETCPVEELQTSLPDQALYDATVAASTISLIAVLDLMGLIWLAPMIALWLLQPILIGLGIFGLSTGLLWYSRDKRATRTTYKRYQAAKEIASLFTAPE